MIKSDTNQPCTAPALGWLWCFIMATCIVCLCIKLQQTNGDVFDTDVLKLLPVDEQQPLVNQANTLMTQKFTNQVLFFIGQKKSQPQDPSTSTSTEKLSTATATFANALRNSGEFETVNTGNKGVVNDMSDVYRPYLYQLLTPETRQQFTQNSTTQLVDHALATLYSPMAQPRTLAFVNDPFNVQARWLQQLQPKGGVYNDGLGLAASDETYEYRVVQARFSGSINDTHKQQALLQAIETATAAADIHAHSNFHKIKDAAGTIVLLKSGVLFHAAAAAQQAKHEMSTVGLGSLAGVVVLLLWYFRRPLPLLLPLVSIGCGLLIAITLSLWVFGRVHVITLAFGASLVGVSIDYALHYLCCAHQSTFYKHESPENNSSQSHAVLQHILPGISLGLLTSLLAYGAQALTPFPGLQQMAVFSALGLVGAWLTVVCWFPILIKPVKSQPSTAVHKIQHPLGRLIFALSKQQKPLLFVLSLCAVSSLYGLSKLHFSDSLLNLQSSPPALLEDEKNIQRISQTAGASRFLLIEAANIEQLLQAEERLQAPLNRLVSSGALTSFQGLAQFVPSQQQQQADFELSQTALVQQGALKALFDRMSLNSAQLSQASALLQQPMQPLTVEQWQQSPVAQLAPQLFFTASHNNQPLSVGIISLGPVSGPQIYTQLQKLVSDFNQQQMNSDCAEFCTEAIWVNRVDDISHLLSRYRMTTSGWVLLASLCILALLSWRYGRRGWQVLAAPLLSIGMTLGLLSLCGYSVSLFHLLAALLVLGIGLDMGIFLRESDRQTHAWEAVTLSAATSLLAFGLLALSQTPVLHFFGSVVLLGIALTWLINLVLIGTPQSKYNRVDV